MVGRLLLTKGVFHACINDIQEILGAGPKVLIGWWVIGHFVLGTLSTAVVWGGRNCIFRFGYHEVTLYHLPLFVGLEVHPRTLSKLDSKAVFTRAWHSNPAQV